MEISACTDVNKFIDRCEKIGYLDGTHCILVFEILYGSGNSYLRLIYNDIEIFKKQINNDSQGFDITSFIDYQLWKFN